MTDARKTELIFGISGQDGFSQNWLATELKQAGFDILSVCHADTPPTGYGPFPAPRFSKALQLNTELTLC